MVTTSHCKARMSQRGITTELLDLVVKFGEIYGDKYILNKKSIQELITNLEQVKKQLLRAKDKGGVVVVVDNNEIITTYNADSYKKY